MVEKKKHKYYLNLTYQYDDGINSSVRKHKIIEADSISEAFYTYMLEMHNMDKKAVLYEICDNDTHLVKELTELLNEDGNHFCYEYWYNDYNYDIDISKVPEDDKSAIIGEAIKEFICKLQTKYPKITTPLDSAERIEIVAKSPNNKLEIEVFKSGAEAGGIKVKATFKKSFSMTDPNAFDTITNLLD